MLLKVFSPYEIVFEKEIEKVNFEGVDGFFTFLPKHIDFVSVLAPSIVTYFEKNNKKSYLACDSGFVLKEGGNVLLSVHNVIEGNNVSNDENSSKLITEKLLKYSIPFKNKENFEFVEINFFIDEVRDLIYLLFNSITFDNSNYVDYYSILLKLKEKTD